MKIDLQKLRSFSLARINEEPTSEMGLAVGAVPYVDWDNGIEIAIHCKTAKAPPSVKLARAESCDVATQMCRRPSLCQLKRGFTRGNYEGPINALTSVEGKMTGPELIQGKYDPEETIPLIVNTDESDSKRTEEALLFQAKNLEKATSVFSVGDVMKFKITPDGIFVGDQPIPDIYVCAWERGDDSKEADQRASLLLEDGRYLNASVPGAALLALLRDYLREE